MCGITGFVERLPTRTADDCRQAVLAMAGRLRHRGPDDQGVWVDAAAGVALGHRRLSILDLSAEGHQPMLSADGRYVLTFNGEIYNFAAIRQELEEIGAAPAWRGHSDTEIILAAFSRWGIRDTVSRMVGMFAFGVWDRARRELWLVRDRLGEKPLYYGVAGDALLFGSELKALRAHPAWGHPEVDREALALYMRLGYVPAPGSIYKGVFKLPPATLLRIPAGTIGANGAAKLVPEPYWDLHQVALRGCESPFAGTETEAAEELERLLRRAVRGQMVADVPLGAFLSGGVDSSTVVAMMQAESTRPVRTFTVGFREQSFDESPHAKAVARHLGTDHTELYATPAEALAVIPRLPEIYDEPFADSSQVPTFLVAKLARQHVTVSLSGDGGDEIFGGYNRYFWGRRIWNASDAVPAGLRRLAGRLLTGVPPERWDALFAAAGGMLGRRPPYGISGDQVHKVAHMLRQDEAYGMYVSLVSQCDPSRLVLGAGSRDGSGRERFHAFGDFTQAMMCLDALTYLPDDILAKVDRAAMAVALETRIPFLDHRVVEFAWTLPLTMKVREKQGKRLLRRLLYRHVPKELVERPKMGFGVPLAAWLRGPLRDWAEHLLDRRRLEQQGFLDAEQIARHFADHQRAERNAHGMLWNVLMFQAWLEAEARESSVATSA